MKLRSHNQATRRVLGPAAVIVAVVLMPSGGTALAAWPESASAGSMLGAPAHRGLEGSESASAMMRFRRRVFDLRPAPARPQPRPVETEGGAAQAAAAPAPSGSVTEIIYAAAAEYGLDGAYLVSVAECESGLDPGAVNAAGYYGLFQFDDQTWAAYGSGSIFDPAAQARAAAMLIAGGQASRWPNCA